jgi:hypothetical protein
MSERLPSGLPDLVEHTEPLARFLRSSSQFSSAFVKASAFLPARDDMTSVARHGAEPRAELWKLAEVFLGAGAKIHGAAVCVAGAVREQNMDVVAAEPPPRHANIVSWPVDADPDLQKARRKELALAIAAQSTLVRPDA